ncbi:S-(hydroxymethyl)glutathione dehydrogenase [Coccidioides immitis RMSCC 3703]|uniref:S-(Hydroxymethyl)glutathione dehydrogenase n=1 Tax=Coccidioides immitis RMSCC 3703 TaxID=454286 RepID=A0A0J8QKJ2_COCIT|nr:S-(hydroxymethyl)glutathione dehydrogenase [Coccidioides immitis RMSCC 3703]
MGDLQQSSGSIVSKAYVVESEGAPFVLKDVVLDQVQPDEVLVELNQRNPHDRDASFVVDKDIVVQNGGMPIGSYPAVLGHEGVGIVRQVGSQAQDKSLKEGDTVLLGFRTCRKCPSCLEGRCEYNFMSARLGEGAKPIYSLTDGTPVHGQFFGQSSLSKMAIVAEHIYLRLAAGTSPVREPSSTCSSPNQPQPWPSWGWVLLAWQHCSPRRQWVFAQIIAVDIVDSKLDLAVSLGATHTINTKQVPDLCTGIRNLLPDGVDQIVDTTGVSPLLQASMKALGHEGVLALVGVPRPGDSIQVDALDLLVSCKRVVGVIEGFADPKELIPRLVKLYREGNFAIDRISTVYAAERLDEAMEDLKAGREIKPVLSRDGI